MGIIERAAEKLAAGSRKSLVEKAVEKIAVDGSATATAPVRDTATPAPTRGPAGPGDKPGDGANAVEARPAHGAARRKPGKRASIDLDRLRAMGMITPGAERTLVAEEFRIVKRSLLLKAFAQGEDALHNGHLILITSSWPQEGKTFTAVNLALSIALERDTTVLLVDADLANPSIPKVLGLQADKGLVDVLTDDELDLSDVLIRTDVPNLVVLPAGSPTPLATELLASDKMGRLVKDMARRYPDRMIIFDSPPALASSETGVLALHVGQVVMVVEADRTSQVAIESALEMVNRCKHIGIILNKTRSSTGHGSFGSYYGYYKAR